MAYRCSNARKSCTSITLNKNLEKIELSEEGRVKAFCIEQSSYESKGKVPQGN